MWEKIITLESSRKCTNGFFSSCNPPPPPRTFLVPTVQVMGFTYEFSLIGGVCVLSVVITFGTPRLASIT